MQGPEDTKWWIGFVGQTLVIVETCGACSSKIKFWHCANAGCPWCAACGVKYLPKNKKKEY